MSEPCSFFSKIKIREEKLNEFLNSKPEQPKLDDNWIAWWSTRKMYTKTDLTENILRPYQTPNNEAFINDWKKVKESFTFSDYDHENKLWHFGIIMFSENYAEMIPTLSFIKSIAAYKEEETTDFAIVYPYFWGDDDVDAYIKYKNNKALLDPGAINKFTITPEDLKYAEVYLGKKWIEFERNVLPKN